MLSVVYFTLRDIDNRISDSFGVFLIHSADFFLRGEMVLMKLILLLILTAFLWLALDILIGTRFIMEKIAIT